MKLKACFQVLTKHIKEQKGDDNGGPDIDSTTAALTAQVRRLTQELRQLASSAGRPIVVNSHTGRGGGFMSLVVPVAIAGAAGYGYMWWKGLTIGDLMYVTKKGMASAVSNFTKQMEGLTTALAATKRQLAGRLDGVAKAVNETTETVNFVRNEILEARGDVGRLCLDVNSLHHDFRDMKDQLETIGNQQQFTNHGIMLLCRFAIEAQAPSQQPKELIQGLHAYSRGATARSLSVPQNLGGLKLLEEIQGIAEVIKPDGPQLPPLGGSSSSSAAVPPRPPPTVLTRSMSAAR